ncbi:MAG: alpha/beta family hydrolase [Casimicrobiaceae bacterium]
MLTVPSTTRACYAMAHGAGAGIQHAFMTAVAEGLAGRAVATLRYQFPYMERGSRRPDSPKLAQATVRAACAEAQRRLPGVPLLAGGKSFGGRMTSHAQAAAPLEAVRGLVFFGFPLHPARKPSAQRAAHLAGVHIPMLFLQGTRDDLAELGLLRPVIDALVPRATLATFDDADHSFHVRARSGSTDADVLAAALDRCASWVDTLLTR